MEKVGNTDFKFVDFDNGPEWGVELLSGRLAGIVIKYGKSNVSWMDDPKSEERKYKIDFAFDIVKNNSTNVDKKDPELHQIVGNILANLMIEMAKRGHKWPTLGSNSSSLTG